ncbi:MAG: hypothetical protein Q9209_004172 [Squamulea sp. 1 TL-2023]
MAPTLKQSAAAEIRSTINQITTDGNKIPGCVFCVVNKDGKSLFEHASGKRGAGTQAPMTLDTIFWIASCTKMICGIAVMRLCEQDKISLDDAGKVEDICPELKKIRILKSVDENGKPELLASGEATTRDAATSITNISPRLVATPSLMRSFDDGANRSAVGIDWAGTIVERISGMPLNDYFQKNIFQPLGIKNISFFPSDEMKNNLAHMHQRDTNGNIRERDHLLRRPLVVEGDDVGRTYNSAGAGCFAQASSIVVSPPTEVHESSCGTLLMPERTEILSTLLNDGVSPTTSAHILSEASIKEMFTNQIPQFPDFGRRGIPTVKPDLTNPIPDMYPQLPEQPQGWGLTFMMTIYPAATGRGANTAWWAGLANLYWWCDREKGIAGMCASQILPFADPNVLGLWAQVESMVYANLEGEETKEGQGSEHELGAGDVNA